MIDDVRPRETSSSKGPRFRLTTRPGTAILRAGGKSVARHPGVASLLRHIALFLVLLVFWTLLSGQINPAESHDRYLMLCGVVSAAIGTWAAARVGFLYDEGDVFGIALRQIPYLAWLFGQIFLANIEVAKRVWRRKLDVDPVMVRIPYSLDSNLATAIYGNSITLTPGTVTVMIDEDAREILVHALDSKSTGGLRAMHDQVKRLEGASSPAATSSGGNAS